MIDTLLAADLLVLLFALLSAIAAGLLSYALTGGDAAQLADLVDAARGLLGRRPG